MAKIQRIFFSNWSKAYHNQLRKVVHDIIKKHKSGGKCLDIGCNYSLASEILGNDDNYEIDAFDIDPAVISAMKGSYKNVSFFVGDAHDPPPICKKSSYDMIFAIEIIEHLTNPQFAFKKWCELLKKDGILILSTPNAFWFGKRGRGDHIYHFDLKTLEAMGKENGLDIVEKIGIGIRTFTGSIDTILPISWIYKFTMPMTYSFPQFASNIVIIYKK
ncbi:MAG: class I SAM-dependent methyltransferase [Candidatus Micrarchaeia archaeon]